LLAAAAVALLRRCSVCLWFRDSKCLSLTSQHPQVMCPLLEKGASSSLFFSALFMSVQEPCLKIGAWPTPVTAGGAIAAAANVNATETRTVRVAPLTLANATEISAY
jgi:hypothetical protein